MTKMKLTHIVAVFIKRGNTRDFSVGKNEMKKVKWVDLIKLSQTWKGYNPCCVCMTLLSGISHSKRYQVENDVVSHFSFSLFHTRRLHRVDDIQFSTMKSDMFAQQWPNIRPYHRPAKSLCNCSFFSLSHWKSKLFLTGFYYILLFLCFFPLLVLMRRIHHRLLWRPGRIITFLNNFNQ